MGFIIYNLFLFFVIYEFITFIMKEPMKFGHFIQYITIIIKNFNRTLSSNLALL